ncbi:MAG: hypothetical protein DIKNOCCD_00889 [bacterium]|nr:hypothetical protein [bacterium]
MRMNSGIAAIVGLIAILLTPMAALANAPIAKELPDIRNAINPAGSQGVVLDLDEYVIDAEHRDQATSAQQALTWTENGSNTAVVAGNELQVTIPTGSAAANESVTFTVSDGSGSDQSGPIRVHTSDVLLGAPLVDTQLGAAMGAGSTIPYTWCVQADPNGSGPIQIPFAGAVSRLTVTQGFSQTCLYAASQIASVTNPLAPYQPGVVKLGQDATGPSYGVVAGNLSIDADINGLNVVPLAGFAGCVRVTVTREFAANNDDSYTVAIADFLNGTNTNLQGTGTGASTISTVKENYGFDNLTVQQLIGAPSANDYNTATNAQRATFTQTQATNWLVTALNQGAGGNLNGSILPDMDITSNGKPSATYPGATDGNALKLTFTRQNAQGVLIQHKGIPSDQYDPGDVITFSVNTYFDLGYTGAAADEAINESTNGLVFALQLHTMPSLLSLNLNYVNFALSQASAAPFRKGPGGASPLYGRGGGQAVNAITLLHGKWTRHEVSFRVPQLGQNVQGTVGAGNLVDSIGLGAILVLGRNDCQANIVNQNVWVDNLCISRCPGALAMAYGSIDVPMVSAGFAIPFNNGATSGPAAVFTNPNFYGAIAMPAALARGETIYGSASQGGTGSAQPVTGRNPSTVFGSAPVGHSDAVNNAKAGFVERNINNDLVVVGTGGTDVALDFPVLDDGNRALVLGPAGLAGNAFTAPITAGIAASGHPGVVGAQTPFIDMRLSSDKVKPGLHVGDVEFAGGAGGNMDGMNGNLNPDRINGNVSGVFGVRWFTRSNAGNVSHNPRMDVTFVNADVNLGLVASRISTSLPSADNVGIPSGIWSDDFVSGSVVTFNSYRTYYDLILNNQAGGRFAGQTPVGVLNDLKTKNPGAQLAYIDFTKANAQPNGAAVETVINNPNLKGFDGIFAPNGGTVSQADKDRLPGRYSTAVLSIDEIHMLAVKDVAQFYDEDLSKQ